HPSGTKASLSIPGTNSVNSTIALKQANTHHQVNKRLVERRTGKPQLDLTAQARVDQEQAELAVSLNTPPAPPPEAEQPTRPPTPRRIGPAAPAGARTIPAFAGPVQLRQQRLSIAQDRVKEVRAEITNIERQITSEEGNELRVKELRYELKT